MRGGYHEASLLGVLEGVTAMFGISFRTRLALNISCYQIGGAQYTVLAHIAD